MLLAVLQGEGCDPVTHEAGAGDAAAQRQQVSNAEGAGVGVGVSANQSIYAGFTPDRKCTAVDPS